MRVGVQHTHIIIVDLSFLLTGCGDTISIFIVLCNWNSLLIPQCTCIGVLISACMYIAIVVDLSPTNRM